MTQRKRPSTRAKKPGRDGLGAALRHHRAAVSQAELAHRLGITQAALSLWETGARDLSYEQIYAVETALGLGLGTLGREAEFVLDVEKDIAWSITVATVEEAAAAVSAADTLGLTVMLTSVVSGGASADLYKEWEIVVAAPGPAGSALAREG